MKFTDFDKVSKLIQRQHLCVEALDRLETWLANNSVDDYYLHLSEHSDGSGKIADLAGCYVANDAVMAVAIVLRDKIDSLIDELKSLGVEFSAEDGQ